MKQNLRKKMVYLHLNEGRTIASLSAEYGFAKSTYREWEKKYCEECLENEEETEFTTLQELPKGDRKTK